MLFFWAFTSFLAGQVREQMKLLKHLYLAVSGLPSDEEEVELPDDLTVEKMVTVVAAYFKASNNVFENTVKELVAKVRGTPLNKISLLSAASIVFWVFAVISPALAKTDILLLLPAVLILCFVSMHLPALATGGGLQ